MSPQEKRRGVTARIRTFWPHDLETDVLPLELPGQWHVLDNLSLPRTDAETAILHYLLATHTAIGALFLNPFTAKVAIMRLLGSAPKSHLCDQRRRSKVTGFSDLMTLFIDLGCLYCKQTQRAFNVFKNTLNWLKIDSVDQKFNWLECGNFSQDAGTPGTKRVIAFSQLAVKGLLCSLPLLMSLHYRPENYLGRYAELSRG
jgi:hypothetical protein